VFCRFAGCNLWSGREADRATAVCRFCDTSFVGMGGDGGGRFASADALADAVEAHWQGGAGDRLVVLTGGEPLLQVDAALTAALHARGFRVAVETNGTQEPPARPGLDLCEPEGRSGSGAARWRRAEAGVSAAEAPSRRFSSGCNSGISCCSPWTGRIWRRTRRRRSPIAWRIRAGACPSRHTRCSDCASRCASADRRKSGHEGHYRRLACLARFWRRYGRRWRPTTLMPRLKVYDGVWKVKPDAGNETRGWKTIAA
jgi:hypothetical protein